MAHVEMQSFIWGDPFGQLQELSQGKPSPLAIMDSPDVAHSNVNHTGRKIGYQSELVVMKLVQMDDKVKKKAALQETLDIALELIRKFDEDYQDNKMESFKVISNLTQTQLDNHIGWRVTVEFWFDIIRNTNESKWQLPS